MSHDRTVVRHSVERVHFGFLHDDEIRSMSVKQITSPTTFDALNNPLPGGLYDRALGPTEMFVPCETCGQDQRHCPGHLGHIELAVSVYHPMLFPILYKLLRSKCFSCHRLRLAAFKARVCCVQLMLCDAGDAIAARNLADELNAALTPEDDAADVEAAGAGRIGSVEPVLRTHEKRLRALAGNGRGCQGHDRTFRRELVDDLIKTMASVAKCENCGYQSPKVRKDGHSKLFQRPLTVKGRGTNRGLGGRGVLSAMQTMWRRELNGVGADDSEPEQQDDDCGSDEACGGGGGDAADSAGDRSDHGREEEEGRGGRGGGGGQKEAGKEEFLPPKEVELQMKLLWEKEWALLSLVFGSAWRAGPKQPLGVVATAAVAAPPQVAEQATPLFLAEKEAAGGYRLFFVRLLAVPPPRFRPPMAVGGMVAEHPQNVHLSRVLALNERLLNTERQRQQRGGSGSDSAGLLAGAELQRALGLWIELQDAVNVFMDSSKERRGAGTASIIQQPGLRQVLEKKEGLFRKHMMGKRVNYACRSVISPDPYVGTSEIGIPLRFARVLTYPQPVAPWNVARMRGLVEAGAEVHPGANYVEDAAGRLTDLGRLPRARRQALAARLLSSPGQKVWRHLDDGDIMLVNRQPTLHKPGIMAHRVRVMRAPSYQTIRMHYANCNTYNADFDGDEINCHLPQNEVARAEAALLAFTDKQYIVPTNGKPLRGLIQDHVDAGVKLCCKDTFLTREEVQQLLYQALAGLPGLEIVPAGGVIETPPPAIQRPKEFWTGKQVFSAVLGHLTAGLPQLDAEFKSRTPANAFGDAMHEHLVLFRDGHLLRGVLDKNAFGASECSLVHAVHDAYGAAAAGSLLTALGRVLTLYLQSAGHTCGVEDLTLTRAAEADRAVLIGKALGTGQRAMQEFVFNASTIAPPARGGGTAAAAMAAAAADGEGPLAERAAVVAGTARLLGGHDREAQAARIDACMQSKLNPVASALIKACLPGGQEKPFPQNCFSLMVLTGAKGSMVNHSQISCALGQQALEGRRVPVMVSGKTLPSFEAHDPDPRAGGFITDRFLTGVRPQEYYFHCMAGREGLVDTAVKTSRSGYLQRCLVKHLEELTVAYDSSVRNGEGGILQFLYGEDGVDPTLAKYLDGARAQMSFCARNHRALSHKHALHAGFLERWGFDLAPAVAAHRAVTVAAAADGGGGGGGMVLEPGQAVMARRPAAAATLGEWDNAAELLPGWQRAEVVKAHGGGRERSGGVGGGRGKSTRYTLRFDDSVEICKMPAAFKSPREPAVQPLQPGAGEGAADVAATGGGGKPAGLRRRVALIRPVIPDPVTAVLRPSRDLGCVSERFEGALDLYIKANPDGLLAAPGQGSKVGMGAAEAAEASRRGKVPAQAFRLLMWLKYMRSMAEAGEAVGSIAAQSVGEPSTQMTLNTFHLAGHGGANVTLGIPRLREVLMTASRNLKTPSMTLPFADGVARPAAEALARQLMRLSFSDLLLNEGGVVVTERVCEGSGGDGGGGGEGGAWEREYKVTLRFFRGDLIRRAFHLSFHDICRAAGAAFAPRLLRLVAAELKRSGDSAAARLAAPVAAKKGAAGMGDGEGDEDAAEERIAAATAEGLSDGVLTTLPEADDSEDSDAEPGSGGGRGKTGAAGKEAAPAASAMALEGLVVADNAKKRRKEAEGEDDEGDEDEEQGTVRFGRKKEMASYGDMDEEDDAIWKAMRGGDVFADSGDDGDGNGAAARDEDGGSDAEDGGGGVDGVNDDAVFGVPTGVKSKKIFSGITADRSRGAVDLVLRAPASMRRLLMVGLAEAAAEQTTVRSYAGIARAFVVDKVVDGKERMMLQTEGCEFSTLWELSARADAGAGGARSVAGGGRRKRGTDAAAQAVSQAPLDLRRLESNHVWAVLQSYGVEAARATLVREISGVFGVYGIAVDPRHLGLIADYLTYHGGYRALNRAGLVDAASPCLQMSFETTAQFLVAAALDGRSDLLGSPSARIVTGRVGAFGTGLFDLLVPAGGDGGSLTGASGVVKASGGGSRVAV